MSHLLCPFRQSVAKVVAAIQIIAESFDLHLSFSLHKLQLNLNHCQSSMSNQINVKSIIACNYIRHSNLFCQLVCFYFQLSALHLYACHYQREKYTPERRQQLIWIWNKRLEMPNNGHFHNNANFKEMESSGKDTWWRSLPREPLLEVFGVLSIIWSHNVFCWLTITGRMRREGSHGVNCCCKYEGVGFQTHGCCQITFWFRQRIMENHFREYNGNVWMKKVGQCQTHASVTFPCSIWYYY